MFKPFKVNVFGCKSLNNSRMRAMRWLVKLLWPLVCVLRFAESRSNPDETRLRKHLFDPAKQTEDLKTTPIRHFHEVMNISVATVITKLIALVKHSLFHYLYMKFLLCTRTKKCKNTMIQAFHLSCSQYSTSQVPVPVPVLETEVPVLVPVLEIDIMFLLKTATGWSQQCAALSQNESLLANVQNSHAVTRHCILERLLHFVITSEMQVGSTGHLYWYLSCI